MNKVELLARVRFDFGHPCQSSGLEPKFSRRTCHPLKFHLVTIGSQIVHRFVMRLLLHRPVQSASSASRMLSDFASRCKLAKLRLTKNTSVADGAKTDMKLGATSTRISSMVDKPKTDNVVLLKVGTLMDPSPEIDMRERGQRRLKIKALEAFEAASRHLSVQKAADELGVTPGAVNHHLRYLAEELGNPLFFRSGKAFALTSVGKIFASRVQSAFAEIDRTIIETKGSKQDVIRLALCSSFGPGWLIKRLSEFYARHPEIDLQLILYAQDPDIASYVADAFITVMPHPPGFWSVPLQPEYLVAVHSDPHGNVRGRLPLICKGVSRNLSGDDWVQFSEESGEELSQLDILPRITTSHFLLAYEIAKRGIGIALVPDFLAEEDVNARVMFQLNSTRIETGKIYHFCVKDPRRHERSMRSLMEWLKRESGIFDQR